MERRHEHKAGIVCRHGQWGAVRQRLFSAFLSVIPRTGYDVVRMFAAMVLLVAAGLKGYQLSAEPTIGNSLLDSRWLLMAAVEFELFFGLWLLANILPRPTWAAAIVCFGAFAGISLYKALSGYATCGCFGAVKVGPWYTTCLDVAIVVSLLYWRPSIAFPLPSGEGKGEGGIPPPPFRLPPFVTVLLLFLLLGLPAAYAMGSYTDTTLSDAGQIIGDGKIVVLEPEKWIGKRFPLLPFIEDSSRSVKSGQLPLRERLVEGEWLVVLYRDGCPRCRKILDHYRRNVEQSMHERKQSIPMVVVEIPPVAQVVTPDWCDTGMLDTRYHWFLTTPVALHLHGGVVELGNHDTWDEQAESLLYGVGGHSP
jgi:hypothetical protein